MPADFWSLLHDANNRAVFGWLGGGFIVIVSAFWAVLKFIYSRKPEKSTPTPTVLATKGAVAAGHDIRDSKIDTRRSRSEGGS
jgi:hypothetical protein